MVVKPNGQAARRHFELGMPRLEPCLLLANAQARGPSWQAEASAAVVWFVPS